MTWRELIEELNGVIDTIELLKSKCIDDEADSSFACDIESIAWELRGEEYNGDL